MSFFISKLVGGLVAPGTLLMLALFAALLLHRRRPRASRLLLAASALFVASLSLLPVGHWLIRPLEARATKPSLLKLDHVDGIVLLGGSFNVEESINGGELALNDAGERITALVELSRRYPDARLVFSGGSANALGDARYSESLIAEKLFTALGVPQQRMHYERESRNTWENALFTKRMAQPKPGETWLLVTSAWHMPRSLGCFRKAGWTVTPYPVDYLGSHTGWPKFDAGHELYVVSVAVKEWVGLVSYHLLGRTDTWLPSAPAQTRTST